MATTPLGPLGPLERAVLALVHQGQGRSGWHDIATALSALDVPRAPDVLTVLQGLQAQGLVVRTPREHGADRWASTARGAAALAAPEPDAGPPAHALAHALRQGPMQVITAIQPLIDDVPRLEAALRQIIEQLLGEHDADLAEGVAAAIRYLPEGARAPLARRMAEDARVAARRGLFRAWALPRLDVQGAAWPCLPAADWDALLRLGLADPDAEVRELATALAFGSARGAAVADLALANLAAGDATLRWYSILALGSAADAASLAALRRLLPADDAAEASAAIRALAARTDDRDWLSALDDRRDEVRRAALFALRHVTHDLTPDELAALEAPDRPDDVRAAARACRARMTGEPPRG